MPYARPTLSDLRKQVAADIASALPNTDPLLRFSNLQIMGVIEAGLAHLHYGYLDWISKQSIPATATDEFLEAWAALKGVTRKAAAQASGQITFTGKPGTDIPSGTPISRGDGVLYISTADAVVAGGGTAVVSAQAVVAAAGGNCQTATVMTLGMAIAGMQSNGTVTSAFTGGADVETPDEFRTRMLVVYANPPQGGAVADYIEWATDVPGVTRAWCSLAGGLVYVFIMLDDAESAFGGFPQGTNGVAAAEPRGVAATGDQLTVANAILPLQPVTALVYVLAPVQNSVNFTIANISGVSVAVQTQISAAIADVFFRKGSPAGTIDLSDIESAIAAIAGTEGFVITVPNNNIVNPTSSLPVVGTITYV